MGIKQIVLADSIIGENYVVRETHGPYIRVSNSQEDHTEDGLRFWWQKTSPEEIAERTATTANQGTVLHNYIHGILKGETINVQEEWAKKPVDNFLEFTRQYRIEPVYMEHKMVSDGLGLGGQVDFIGRSGFDKDGEVMCQVHPWILDWKTGGVYRSQAIQVSFYMAMYYENYKDLITNLAIINVPRDGEKITIHAVEKPWAALRAGLCTFERWKFDNAAKLDWVNAPTEITDARKKTKGKKRIQFDEAHWKPEYQWPWVNKDSLEWLDSLIKQLEMKG